ncbi:MAG: thioredoxin family protein [Akkermansiaceae bacterium]
MKKTLLAGLFLTLSMALYSAGSNAWTTDFAAAKSKAAAEKKHLLVNFTGSDWCEFCRLLKEEVFEQGAFEKGVADDFILVELDYPQDTSKLSAKTLEQNASLARFYAIDTYPNILLLDSLGRPFAQTGYQPGGAENFLAHLKVLLKNKDAFTAQLTMADKRQGTEKAQALVDSLSLLPPNYLHFYKNITDQILLLDPEDTTGYTANKKLQEKYTVLEESIGKILMSENPLAAPPLIDQFITDNSVSGDKKVRLLFMKLQIEMNLADTAGDMNKTLKLVDDYIIDQKLEGTDKQEILSMKVGSYINAEEFDNAEKLIDEIIAIEPSSEISEYAVSFKVQLAQMKQEAQAAPKAENPAHGEPGHIHQADE